MTAAVTMPRRGAKIARETREFTVRNVELRASGDSSTLTLDGYACVTEAPYEMQDWLGPYTEVVRGGAFGKTLAEQDDVRLLLNHEGLPLARTKSGTLQLAEDGTGLAVSADLEPRSGLVNDIRSAMERGDLDEMSFAFQVTRQEWSPDFEQRDILEVKLFDVSVVTYPANPATSASLNARMANLTSRLREKRALDAEDVNMLTQALGWLSAIDNIVDAGQDTLATYLQVPNPDTGDDDPAGLAADSVRAAIGRLQKRLSGAPLSDGITPFDVELDQLRLARPRV